METDLKGKVLAWAQGGGDFSAGLSLFLTYNRNILYVRNIEVKGVERGTLTLVNEFANKTKVPAKEIFELINGDHTLYSQPITHKTKKVVITKPESEIRRTKLREEFPFLGRKDCPDELAVIVNKMLTAYDDYRGNRERLFEVDLNNSEACYGVAREVVDAHILNQECWKELNYYKIHGQLLGNLPLFKKKQLREKFGAMSTVVLVKTANNNIPRRLCYYKKQIESGKAKNMDELRKMVADAEDELNMIREILAERGEI